eukprot:8818540-Alexandrium_andersonii.AAC.1
MRYAYPRRLRSEGAPPASASLLAVAGSRRSSEPIGRGLARSGSWSADGAQVAAGLGARSDRRTADHPGTREDFVSGQGPGPAILGRGPEGQ